MALKNLMHRGKRATNCRYNFDWAPAVSVSVHPKSYFNRILMQIPYQITPSCIHLPALLSYTSYHLNAIYAIGKRKLLGNGRHNGVRKC